MRIILSGALEVLQDLKMRVMHVLISLWTMRLLQVLGKMKLTSSKRLIKLAASLSTLELLELQKYDKFCSAHSGTQACVPNPSIYERSNGLMRR